MKIILLILFITSTFAFDCICENPAHCNPSNTTVDQSKMKF